MTVAAHPFIPESTKPETSEAVERFVIRRNGAFFRPNAAGYTNHVIAAGFYTAEEADSYRNVEGVTIEPLARYRADAERTIAEANRLIAALATPAVSVPVGEVCPCTVCREARETIAAHEEGIEAAARAMCDRVNGIGDYDAHIEQRRSGWLAQAQAGIAAYLAASPNPPASPSVAIGAGEVAWTFNPDTRDIEFSNAPVFKVYEADDFPCLEDDERGEADDWYDAQAATVVLVLNGMLHANGDDTPIPMPTPPSASIPADVEREACAKIADDEDTAARASLRDAPNPVERAYRRGRGEAGQAIALLIRNRPALAARPSTPQANDAPSIPDGTTPKVLPLTGGGEWGTGS